MFGNWRCAEKLGKGGNGEVYRATNGNLEGALKIFQGKLSTERAKRFKDEIEALIQCKDILGVLPIFDSSFRQNSPSTTEKPWFVMALAEPIGKHLTSATSIEKIVEAVAAISATLANMHDLGFSHRDVKPDNLFRYKESWAVGDFGLAHFPGKESRTAIGEKVGPIYYIAPEMLNDAGAADGMAADVYSLAKTLWVFATGQKYPIPGSFDTSIPALTISAYVSHSRAYLLDQLIMLATIHTPSKRITMQEFSNELLKWLRPMILPPNNNAFDLSDLTTDFASRKSINDIALAKKADEEVNRSNSRKLIRERFRPYVAALTKTFNDNSFSNVGTSIDNYLYGFKITAVVPWKPWNDQKKFVQLEIHCMITDGKNIDNAKIIIETTVTIFNGHAKECVTLWKEEIEVIPGVPSEEDGVNSLLAAIESDFKGWVAKAVEFNEKL